MLQTFLNIAGLPTDQIIPDIRTLGGAVRTDMFDFPSGGFLCHAITGTDVLCLGIRREDVESSRRSQTETSRKRDRQTRHAR